MTLKIDMIGGNCPVQAEGTVNGQPFYFRARGEHWSMGIGGDPVGEPKWYREREWPGGEYAAGWMDEKEALSLIESTAAAFIAGEPSEN